MFFVKSEHGWKWDALYGDGVIDESIVYKYFASFRSGNFDLEDQESCRPAVIDDYQIKIYSKQRSMKKIG